MQQQEAYPVRLTVDYPDRPLDRLTTGLRIFAAIPILILLGTVSGGGSWESSYDTTRTTTVAAGAATARRPPRESAAIAAERLSSRFTIVALPGVGCGVVNTMARSTSLVEAPRCHV